MQGTVLDVYVGGIYLEAKEADGLLRCRMPVDLQCGFLRTLRPAPTRLPALPTRSCALDSLSCQP